MLIINIFIEFFYYYYFSKNYIFYEKSWKK